MVNTIATTKRRKNDFYPTPEWATEKLIDRCPDLGGLIVEPCSGEGHISNILTRKGFDVWTNDIDPDRPANSHFDAASPEFQEVFPRADWFVTNPPFNQAPAIVPLAYESAEVGIAMLLRLSYLEPCGNRSDWLQNHPPSDLFILPRISFTGDGRTDNCTCAWFVWRKRPQWQRQTIEVIPRHSNA